MDNDTEFNNLKVEEFFKGYGIKLNFFGVYYPHANGMARETNKVIVNNLKKNLGDKKRNCLEELQKVLWVQGMTQKEAT